MCSGRWPWHELRSRKIWLRCVGVQFWVFYTLVLHLLSTFVNLCASLCIFVHLCASLYMYMYSVRILHCVYVIHACHVAGGSETEFRAAIQLDPSVVVRIRTKAQPTIHLS